VYTTWCTYCRQMDANVFSQPQVGGYQNEHFINLKFDALKPDGITIRKSYAVPAIPTFLYLDPHGMLVKKVIGYQSEEQLLQISQTAFTQFVKPASDTLAKQ
jgi:thioredoxin 1